MDENELDDRGWLKVPNRKIKTTKIKNKDGSITYKHEWSDEPLVVPGEIPINGMSVLDFDFPRLKSADGSVVEYEEKLYRLKEVTKKKKKNKKR